MLSSARRPAGIARCRLACANVLHHAVELYGGHTEVHVMTIWRTTAGIKRVLAANLSCFTQGRKLTAVSGPPLREVPNGWD